MQQAYEMAVDALGLAIVSRQEEKKEEIPTPTDVSKIEVSDGFIVVLGFDMLYTIKERM